MRTPAFWKTRNTTSKMLMPLGLLYELGHKTKRAFTVQVKLPVPVVCIGNVTAGGSGKTPLALHIGTMLKAKGVNAFYVSRGYGGSTKGPVLVNPLKHRSYQVGDEPLLLSQVLPTVVGRDRLEAARFAISKGAKMLILDDGFQNKKIYKDFSYLVVNGQVGLGNGLLLPAGPLRERFSDGLKRAHSVVMIDPMPNSIAIPKDRMPLVARTKVTGIAERLRGQKVVAFCGIAFPEKFRATLASVGARVIEFQGFADHAFYRHETLMPLAELASKEKAYMVTTRKDLVRLPRGFRDKVVVVDIELSFEDEGLLAAQIQHISQMA
jgi:tetraacyldisaccharide 4'-kinase